MSEAARVSSASRALAHPRRVDHRTHTYRARAMGACSVRQGLLLSCFMALRLEGSLGRALGVWSARGSGSRSSLNNRGYHDAQCSRGGEVGYLFGGKRCAVMPVMRLCSHLRLLDTRCSTLNRVIPSDRRKPKRFVARRQGVRSLHHPVIPRQREVHKGQRECTRQRTARTTFQFTQTKRRKLSNITNSHLALHSPPMNRSI